jgi:RNA polymerase sigma-70 factor (ECF subfamily)
MAARERDPAGPPAGDPDFQTTRWSLVLAAAGGSSPTAEEALAQLCRAYWYPIYIFARQRVGDLHEAQDLTQEFFARLLEKDYLAGVRPERGRFRSFLRTAFLHFLSKERDKARAQKRGGGRPLLRLDFSADPSRPALEVPAGLTAEELYDRHWALALLGRVLDRLRKEYHRCGSSEDFERLKRFLIGGSSGSSGLTLAQTARDADGTIRLWRGASTR